MMTRRESTTTTTSSRARYVIAGLMMAAGCVMLGIGFEFPMASSVSIGGGAWSISRVLARQLDRAPECVIDLCGTTSCSPSRRELRAQANPSEIRYRLCPAHGFFGQVDDSKVKPTGAIGTRIAANDASACATKCLVHEECQWFVVSNDGCELFKDITLDGVDPDRHNAKAIGFVLAASPNDLIRKLACTETREMIDGSGRKPLKLCRTTSGMVVLSDSVNQCGATPWTLYRAYYTEGFVDTSKSINYKELNELMSTPKRFRAIITDPQNTVEVKTKEFNARGGDLTTWKYHFDAHGRVTSVKGAVTAKNIITDNKYRDDSFQRKFNLVHHLKELKCTDLESNAGHLIGSQFTNPNSFWNFVPQSEKSNQGPGCWYNAETHIAIMLKLGCQGTMKAQLDYFEPADLPQVDRVASTKLKAAKADGMLNLAVGGPTTIDAVYNPNRHATAFTSYPCNYFYRPLSMNLDFRITGADAGSRCEKAWHVVSANNGRFFSLAADDTVLVTRAMVHWAVGSSRNTLQSFMGLATNVAKKCLAETGGMLNKVTFSKAFTKAFLVHIKTGKCLSKNGSAAPTLAACDLTSDTQKWTADPEGKLDTLKNAKFDYSMADLQYPANPDFKMDLFVKGMINVDGTTLAFEGDPARETSRAFVVVYDFGEYKK